MTSHSEPGDGRPDPGLSAIMSERRQLINLGYRLLGSLADAEDVVQPLPDRTEWINGRSGDTTVDPADRVTLDESINMAW